MKKLILTALVFVATIATAQVKVGSNPTTLATNAQFQVEGTTTAEQFVVLNNGNVGIGTKVPTQLLHLEGSLATDAIGTEDVLVLGRGTVSGISWAQAASFAIGNYGTAGNAPQTRLDFKLKNAITSGYVTDVNVMTMQSNGNVGIGTTAPTNTLDVNGTARIRTLAAGDTVADQVLTVDATGVVRKVLIDDLVGGETFEPIGTVFVNTANPNTATAFYDDPDDPTHDPLLIQNTNLLYSGTDGSTWIWNGTTYVTKAMPNRTEWNFTGTNTDAGKSKTANIARSGFVGIGAAAVPYVALRVYNSKPWYQHTNGNKYHYGIYNIQPPMTNSTSTTTSQVGIYNYNYLNQTAGTNGGYMYGLLNASIRNGTGNNGTLAGQRGIQTSAGHFPTSSSGTGTTTAVYGVYAINYASWGTIGTSIQFYGTATVGGTINSNWGVYCSNSNAKPLANYLAGSLGVSTTSSVDELNIAGTAAKTGGGTWAVLSDARLKKDVTTYSEGLSLINKVRTVNFKYNEDYINTFVANPKSATADKIRNTTYQGVIAQELKVIAPDMVKTIKESQRVEATGEVIPGTEMEVLQVDPNKFTYALINAVKELNAEVEALKAEVAKLKK